MAGITTLRFSSFLRHKHNGHAGNLGMKLSGKFSSPILGFCRQHNSFRGFTTLSQDPPTTLEEKHRLTSIRLYRILQRACRALPVKDENDPILIQPELEARDWGKHLIYKPPSPTMVEELFRLFYVMNDDADHATMSDSPSIDDWYYQVLDKKTELTLPPMTAMSCWTSAGQLQQAIRTAFRVTSTSDQKNTANLHTWAIRAVQLLQEQQLMWNTSSVATTRGIRVTATSRYDKLILYTFILLHSIESHIVLLN